MAHESLSDSEVKRAFATVVSETPELSPEAVARFAQGARQHQPRSSAREVAGWRFVGSAGLVAATAVGFWIGAVPLASVELIAPDENEAFWQSANSGVVSVLSEGAEQEIENG